MAHALPRFPWRTLPLLSLPVLLSRCAHTDPTAAPAASAEPAPLLGLEPRAHPPGELGRAPDYTMSVEGTKECVLDGPFRARPGHVKLGVEIVIEGTSAREVPVNPFYGRLELPGGSSYPPTLAGCEPSLPAIRVTGGRKARGYVTFELPVGARRAELRYSPVVIGPGAEELRFALEW